MRKEFDIKAFENLPSTLKKADRVDLLLLLIGSKPCVRLGNANPETVSAMKCWCRDNGFKYSITTDNYFYIANSKVLARFAQIVDNSTFNHSYLFGRILGYPKCCCKRISEVGESNIDSWEKEFCSQNSFDEEYKLINPSLYLKGSSFISHIPCCSTCKESLSIAKKTYRVVSKYKDLECFRDWNDWFK